MTVPSTGRIWLQNNATFDVTSVMFDVNAVGIAWSTYVSSSSSSSSAGSLVGVVGEWFFRLLRWKRPLVGVVEPDCCDFLRLSSASSRATRLISKRLMRNTRRMSLLYVQFKLQFQYDVLHQYHFIFSFTLQRFKTTLELLQFSVTMSQQFFEIFLKSNYLDVLLNAKVGSCGAYPLLYF